MICRATELGCVSIMSINSEKSNLTNTESQKLPNCSNLSNVIKDAEGIFCFYGQLFLSLICWFSFLPVSAIQITELMYHPPNKEKGGNFSQSAMEFIELYNEKADYLDLGNWQFTQGITFQFPEGTIIDPKTYFLVAKDPIKLKQNYAVFYKQNISAPIFGPFQGQLSDKKDRLILSDPANGLMIDFTYSDQGRWPMAADGSGHTLAKISPRLNDNLSTSWRSSKTFTVTF